MAIEAPESVVQEIENTVCPKMAKDGTLVPLEPRNESPFVLEIVQSDTPAVPQLTNVDSPLRRRSGATCQLVMFGGGGGAEVGGGNNREGFIMIHTG